MIRNVIHNELEHQQACSMWTIFSWYSNSLYVVFSMLRKWAHICSGNRFYFLVLNKTVIKKKNSNNNNTTCCLTGSLQYKWAKSLKRWKEVVFSCFESGSAWPLWLWALFGVDWWRCFFCCRTLLQGATLHLVSGRRYGLIGRNGLGKTTLLKLISRLVSGVAFWVLQLSLSQIVSGVAF